MSDRLFMVSVSLSGVYDSKVVTELIWATNREEATGKMYFRALEAYGRYTITDITPTEVAGLLKQEDVQHDMDLLTEYETLVHRIRQECKDPAIVTLIEESGL